VGRKRTEITIETERILLISRRPDGSIRWCDRCARRVLMLTVNEAAAVLRISVDEMMRKLEDQQLHFVQRPGERLLICPNSLLE
jgi:hypothetical protein